MQVIKKIDVGSAAKVYGLTLGILGFVIGLIYALIFSSISSIIGEEIPMAGAGLGLALVIFIPITYGVVGVVVGALGAVVLTMAYVSAHVAITGYAPKFLLFAHGANNGL